MSRVPGHGDGMRRAASACALALACVIGLAVPATGLAASSTRVGGQYRYWSFSNDNDLRDVLVYWSARWFHLQL